MQGSQETKQCSVSGKQRCSFALNVNVNGALVRLAHSQVKENQFGLSSSYFNLESLNFTSWVIFFKQTFLLWSKLHMTLWKLRALCQSMTERRSSVWSPVLICCSLRPFVSEVNRDADCHHGFTFIKRCAPYFRSFWLSGKKLCICAQADSRKHSYQHRQNHIHAALFI